MNERAGSNPVPFAPEGTQDPAASQTAIKHTAYAPRTYPNTSRETGAGACHSPTHVRAGGGLGPVLVNLVSQLVRYVRLACQKAGKEVDSVWKSVPTGMDRLW